MRIKMIKVYRGNTATYMPGEKVEGEMAERIAENHPTWCEVIEDKPAGPAEDKQMKPEKMKNEEVFVCEECGREFDSPQGLAAHSRVHK